MKRLTEHTIPETGFSVVSQEKYKRILMDKKPSVEKVYNRLKKIEDILGDEYELDRLREFVEAEKEDRYIIMKEPRRAGVHRLTELADADREGRCVVLPIKVPGWGWYCNDKFPNAISAYFDRPSQVVDCMEDYILRGTKEQAKAALKAREQE